MGHQAVELCRCLRRCFSENSGFDRAGGKQRNLNLRRHGGKFIGKTLRQGDDGKLGRGVGGHQGAGQKAAHRCRVDDARRALGLDQARHKSAQAVDDAVDIDLPGLLPLGVADFPAVTGGQHPCVVEQQIDLTKGGVGLVSQGIERGLAGDIGHDRQGLIPQFSGDLIEARLVAIGQHHLHSPGDSLLGETCTNTTGRTSDDSYFHAFLISLNMRHIEALII